MIIFPALWLEGTFRGAKSKKKDMSEVELPEDSPLIEKAAGNFEETLKLKEQQE